MRAVFLRIQMRWLRWRLRRNLRAFEREHREWLRYAAAVRAEYGDQAADIWGLP